MTSNPICSIRKLEEMVIEVHIFQGPANHWLCAVSGHWHVLPDLVLAWRRRS